MTTFRLISLPAHGVIEMLFGMATLAAPFALGFGPAATISAVVIGAVIIGLALGAAVEDRDFSVSAHFAADRGMAFGLLVAGAILALASDPPAGAYFVGGGLLLGALSLVTRYSKQY
jgi:hypothetical protein